MVRLLLAFCVIDDLNLNWFQSHNGAIAARPLPSCLAHIRFNPTMVRLLRLWRYIALLLLCVFQSHNGAIAAIGSMAIGAMALWFQSHNGAIAAPTERNAHFTSLLVSIPQWCDCCHEHQPQHHPQNLRFNPTMVRLLQAIKMWLIKTKDRFQSHNGAIAAYWQRAMMYEFEVSIPQWCDCCWVREKVLRFKSSVSIPQWCDCCKSDYDFQSPSSRVSIPQWCDCCSMTRLMSFVSRRVSIPQWCDCCGLVMLSALSAEGCFNPTMVRLLPRQRVSRPH